MTSRKRKFEEQDEQDDQDDGYVPPIKVPRLDESGDVHERKGPKQPKSKTISSDSQGTEKKKRVKKEKPLAFKHGTLARGWERALAERGFKAIAGVDEAGRGPLAGSVVAAACIVPADEEIAGINDSKKLNERQLEHLFERLTTNPRVVFAVSIIDHKRIDQINILRASMEAMSEAVAALAVKADYVLVDGDKLPSFETKVGAEAVIKGDGRVYSIAAASVIAKVTRDRIMVEMHDKWPEYNFASHKGYPTKEHKKAIAEHGPCPIHRMTFKPLKVLVKQLGKRPNQVDVEQG